MAGYDNKDRAISARETLDYFAKRQGVQDEDRETQLSDLLCNLMHYARAAAIDFDSCLTRGHGHYTEELEEERDEIENG